ncbi:MAG: HNH endonuclease [Candidatus Bathyarchaeota archaeon]|nr:HNH endonuclease [Candidatus Termiticorpusculum sp.]
MLSKTLKQALIGKHGARCFIYYETMSEDLLQVDHRVPYEIGGEPDEKDIEKYMLLCPSANRAKSWTCEHCANWTNKEPTFCVSCYWAHPENYEHIAGKQQKVISVMFTGDEVEDYKRLIEISGIDGAQKTIKRLVRDFVE